MNKDVIIIGAGGHARVIADIVLSAGDRVFGFLDDRADGEVAGISILGKTGDWINYRDAEFIIGIGDVGVRDAISAGMHEAKWYTAIHPSAVISRLGVHIGKGTAVMANAVINPGAVIGKHCIVNTSAVVEHDCVIDDFAHISVGAKLAGNVRIGSGSWIGIGTAVSNNLNICGGCMIGAGAAVVRNITEQGTYVGVPARKIK